MFLFLVLVRTLLGGITLPVAELFVTIGGVGSVLIVEMHRGLPAMYFCDE
jgi:hypothetical protein